MSEENCHEQAEYTSRLNALSVDEQYELLGFANMVQTWSLKGHRRTPRYGTFAQAAAAFGTSVERIAMAVEAHYWMFADDPSAPLAERQIEHEGE